MTATDQRPPRHPRHRGAVAAATLLLTIGLVGVTATPAAADRPRGQCPGDRWSMTTLPAHGSDTSSRLWQSILAGLHKEFHSIPAALAAFGVADLNALAALLRSVVGPFDKNRDGLLCFKDRPDTRGNPAFIFTGTDNTAHSRR